MPRNKAGKKSGRKEKNMLFQKALREAKKLRKQRRQEHGVLTHKEKFERARAENPGERLMTTKQGKVVTHRSVHEFELGELPGSTVEGRPVTLDDHGFISPTEEEWQAVLDEAKRRKKSVVKVAKRHGWVLTDEGAIKQDKAALRDPLNYERATEEVAA